MARFTWPALSGTKGPISQLPQVDTEGAIVRSAPTKLLFVIDGLGTGGAERSLAEMLPGLLSAGFVPSIFYLYQRPVGVEADVSRLGIEVRLLEGRRLLSRVAALRRHIARIRPDIIHTTIFESNLTGRLAAIGSGTALLTSIVNTPFASIRRMDPHVRGWRLTAARLFERAIASHLTTHFHAITHAVKADAVHVLGISSDRITVVERGRDPSRLGSPGAERRRTVRQRLGLRDEDEVLLNVGRQEYQKGQRFLLEAFARLAPDRPRMVLLIAGRPGLATPDLRLLAAGSSARDRIRILGHRSDVPDLLAATDLFVFPSLYEGLGGALIEAMALGLPIVASDLPAVREVVEADRNALLVPPASPPSLARAIETILDNRSLAKQFGVRSLQIFENRFTLERSVRAMIALYQTIAASRRNEKSLSGSPSPSTPPAPDRQA